MRKQEKIVEDNNEVLVPEDNASFFKRLANPGYLLLHPEKTKKAIVLTIIRNFLYLLVGGVIAGYLATEIATFVTLAI
jgi:hypothetical protein